MLLVIQLEQLEIRAVQLDKEEDHLRTIIKEENKLKKEIEELQADVYRIEVRLSDLTLLVVILASDAVVNRGLHLST